MTARLKPVSCGFSSRKASGFTQLELLIGLAIGVLILAGIAKIYQQSRSSLKAEDDASRISESGRFALAELTRLVRQSGYVNQGSRSGIAGVDFCPESTTSNTQALGASSKAGAAIEGSNGVLTAATPFTSDSLILRYYGSGDASSGDAAILDCAGTRVAGATSSGVDDRQVDRLYVGIDSSDGQSALRCDPGGSRTTQSLVANVDSFQVLYGVADAALNPMSDDGALLSVPARFVSANQVPSAGGWANVTALRISLMIHGDHPSRAALDDADYDLFGAAYSSANAGQDPGVKLKASQWPIAARRSYRKVFSTTIALPNVPYAHCTS